MLSNYLFLPLLRLGGQIPGPKKCFAYKHPMGDRLDKKSVLDNIRHTVYAANPKAKVFLFGSQARGDARADSDWDVLILLDKEKITSTDQDNISYSVRKLGWDIDEIINPIMYTVKDWESKSFTPLYKNIMKERIVL